MRPDLNAVIRAVVKTATCEYGMRVIGIEDGFEGLLGATRRVAFTKVTCADCCRAVARFSAHAIADTLSNALVRRADETSRASTRKRSPT
jgi:hypothetical protein